MLPGDAGFGMEQGGQPTAQNQHPGLRYTAVFLAGALLAGCATGGYYEFGPGSHSPVAAATPNVLAPNGTVQGVEISPSPSFSPGERPSPTASPSTTEKPSVTPSPSVAPSERPTPKASATSIEVPKINTKKKVIVLLGDSILERADQTGLKALLNEDPVLDAHPDGRPSSGITASAGDKNLNQLADIYSTPARPLMQEADGFVIVTGANDVLATKNPGVQDPFCKTIPGLEAPQNQTVLNFCTVLVRYIGRLRTLSPKAKILETDIMSASQPGPNSVGNEMIYAVDKKLGVTTIKAYEAEHGGGHPFDIAADVPSGKAYTNLQDKIHPTIPTGINKLSSLIKLDLEKAFPA